MAKVFDVIFGFGLEALAFAFWVCLGGVLCTLLVTFIKWFETKRLIAAAVASAVILALVGDHRAFVFWGIITGVIIIVTSSQVVEAVTKRFSWIRSITYYGICALIVSVVFIMMRAVLFQDVPYQMWYQ